MIAQIKHHKVYHFIQTFLFPELRTHNQSFPFKGSRITSQKKKPSPVYTLCRYVSLLTVTHQTSIKWYEKNRLQALIGNQAKGMSLHRCIQSVNPLMLSPIMEMLVLAFIRESRIFFACFTLD